MSGGLPFPAADLNILFTRGLAIFAMLQQGTLLERRSSIILHALIRHCSIDSSLDNLHAPIH